MAQSGFGFWKILAILMVIVTIGNCAALTSAVDVVSESNRNTSPATSYMPEDYSLIRVGVNNASLGDVIVVYNETYEENVTVNRRGALVVQMNNLTDSRTSVSGWETAKIITFLSKDTDSIQLISVTPPAGTTLQRGTVVPFEVTVDYSLESVAAGFVGAELGLSDGRCVYIGDRVEVTQGHGTAVIRGSIDVDHLYDWLQSDTVYIALSLGYKKDPTHSILLIWKHMPDQCYFIAGAPPQSYAIIAAGEGGRIVKPAIDHSANNAYRVLRNLGFDDDHIFYLNSNRPQDVDGDGDDEIDALASFSNFDNAINEVKDKIGDNPTPFILFLTGHGLPGQFLFDGSVLWDYQLKGMLEEFPSETRMVIFINSCYSGYFITSINGISASNRIIITGTHNDQKRLWIPWLRSSDRFWGNLNNGLNVKDAFITGGWREEWWHLWLDDNEDRIGSPPNNLGEDGNLAARTQIGVPGTENLKLTPWIFVWKRSPGELRVYDSQNRVTGLVNGEVEEEIPDSIYDEQDEIVALFFPSDTYRYEVAGTDEGTYGLDIASIEEGDATTFTATNVTTSTNATHQYTIDWDALAQGEEGVTIQIDSDGDGTFEQNITTDDTFHPPIASFFPTTPSPVVGEEITFNATSSYDPDGTITKYEWNFGDGNTTDATESLITHSYVLAGEYTVNLIVTDDDGATNSTSQLVTVTLQVGNLDLIITEKWLCWPDNCTICYNVTNIGNATAPACHNTTLHVDGVEVAHDHVPVDLAPGESYTGCFNGYEWTYTPPSDNITVCADNNETVDELDETNNCLTNIWMCGDVNCDGKVTMSDVRKVFNRYLDPNYPLDLPWAADVNCDGKVTMSDVRKVFNRYLDPGYELNCCCEGEE